MKPYAFACKNFMVDLREVVAVYNPSDNQAQVLFRGHHGDFWLTGEAVPYLVEAWQNFHTVTEDS